MNSANAILKFLSIVMSATLMSGLANGESAFPTASSSTPRSITILHTNDIHGHLTSWTGWEGELMGKSVGGYARLAGRIRELRSAVGEDKVLLLDAGDTIGDAMVAVETEGRAIIEVMNAMRYDAMVIGNHEPDFTAETLRARIDGANFPVLAANIRNRTGRLFTKPYVVREVNGVRVGILGIAYPNTPLTSAKRNVVGLVFEDAVETARTYLPQMRRDGAEILVALTHLGLSADKDLAEKVPDIDVIVGGHSHNRMKEALRVGKTLIVQAGAHGSDLGRLDLTIDQGRVVASASSLIPMLEGETDDTVAAIVEKYHGEYRNALDERVGRAAGFIIRAQTLPGQSPEKRDAESPADDLFTDAIREITGAQIAFLPGLGYGVAFRPGDITAADLRNLIPHDSAVWTMELTGAQIRQVLEQAIENFSSKDIKKKVGGMIQMSGLHFSYRTDAPQGRRVQEATVGGQPISANRMYTVAVNGLLAEGGHNYAAFTKGSKRRELGKQYEVVKAWLARRSEVVAPATDRITKLPD